MLYLQKLIFFKLRVNCARSRPLDGQDFANGKNGPRNFKERAFSSIFNGEKVLDPDGLIYGKDTKAYTDQIFGTLHAKNCKPFIVFWRELKKAPKEGYLLAQQLGQDAVFILQRLVKNPLSNGNDIVKLEGPLGQELEVFPYSFEEVKDGLLIQSLLMVSQLHQQIGRIPPPKHLPMVPLDPIQLANTRVRSS